MNRFAFPFPVRALRTLAACSAFAVGGAYGAPVVDVTASFSILGDLVHQVGGDRVRVSLLIGPDQDAHAFQPRPSDARKLADARLIVANGLGFDDWVTRLAHSAGASARVLIASAGASTLEMDAANAHDHGHDHDHGHANEDHKADEHHAIDPHAWQDVANVRRYVANITDALIAADPQGADGYRSNAAAYDLRLKALDEEIRTAFAALPAASRQVVSSHDAFAYFGRAYGLRFLAPVGVSNNAEPSAAGVARLIRQLRAENVRAVFVENVNDPRLIERIRSESGARVGGTLYSDALSTAAGPAPDYLSMMRHNFETIRAALSAD